MSSVTQVKSTWWRQNYEKLVLVLVLLALLVSTAVLFVHINEGQRQVQITARDVPSANQPTVSPLDATANERSMARLRQPLQSGLYSNLMFISEQRVWCVRCGKPIPLAAEKCPFCGAPQPEYIEGDADGDGMPDEFEKTYGFNLNDPTDARQDADGDGFSNLEESRASTNPRDEKSSPDVIAKVRLEKVTQRPIPLLFVGVQNLGGGDLRFQINVGARSYFAKIGDVVGGYKVLSYDDGSQTLVAEKGEKPVPLKKNRRTIAEEIDLQFVFLIDGVTVSGRLDETFRVRTKEYIVVKAGLEEAEVKDKQTQQSYTVRKMSQAEEMELSDRRSRMSPFEGFGPSVEQPAPRSPPVPAPAPPPAYTPPAPAPSPAYTPPAYVPPPSRSGSGHRAPPPLDEMAPPQGDVGPQP